MIGVWLEGGRISVRHDLEPPRAGNGEAVVRVLAAGVCGTDLELAKGYRPFAGVPGHEFVGRVEAGPDAWAGRRVVAEINVGCAASPHVSPCGACAAGRARHCERRRVLGIEGRDGAFAELVRVPVANLHAVPEAVSDEAAVFTEPLAAAFRAVEQADAAPHDRVLVVGPGRLGQLVARALATGPGRVEVAGRSDGALDRARATGLVAHRLEDVSTEAYDIAVDCTGHPDGFDLARRALRPEGTLILKSTYAGAHEVDASSLVVHEIRVLGSRCGPFEPALRALAEGTVRVDDLVHARFALADAPAAFARAAEPGALKVLLLP